VSKLRLLTALLILIAMLVATWSLANIRSTEPIPTDRIAYVDDDGVIRTIRSDGSRPIRISPDVEGFFTWPTWSSNSRRLVYSGVTGGRDDIKMSLYASRSSGTDSIEIFAGDEGVTGQLALGVIHYPLWSPSGENVAFIAATAAGLTLFMDDLSTDPSATPLVDNGPLWIAWSPRLPAPAGAPGRRVFSDKYGGERCYDGHRADRRADPSTGLVTRRQFFHHRAAGQPDAVSHLRIRFY